MQIGKIAVIIPACKVADTVKKVVQSIPDSVHSIIVVDDKCPQGSGREAETLQKDNLTVLCHTSNKGVGGAVGTGYRKALEQGCDILLKMDGDGQMDSSYLDKLVAPLLNDAADYTKGNRFRDFKKLKTMPGIRLFGNSILSFVVKIASGYWNIMDPTNGYTAIHRKVLERLDIEKIAERYFFESDMLINLNIINAVVKDIEIPSKYGNEISSLRIRTIVMKFPFNLLKGLIKRIFLKYFVHDFNMASLYILLGLPMFLFGTTFGVLEWIDSIVSGETRSAGTIMLVALPIIVSFQMLLQAINIDINSIPRRDR
jgi:hypothetical protein